MSSRPMTLSERHCCDGLCVQGRDCPRKPARKPARPASMPREQRRLFIASAERRFWPAYDEWRLCLWIGALDLTLWASLIFSIFNR